MVWVVIAMAGFFAAYQGGMNRLMGQEWGLPAVVLENAVVFLIAAIALFAGVHWGLIPPNPLFENLNPFQKMRWWYILPGLFGFGFVMGVPFAISRVGAVLTFMGLVIAQIVAGATWDYFIESKSIPMQRVAGILVALIGIWLASRKVAP